jgi:spore coat protein U-like protein
MRKLAFLAFLVVACGGKFAAAASCTISATSVAFGNYSGATVDVTGTITFKCPPAVTYQIALNAGTSAGATVTNRSMTGPNSSLLNYALYSNSGYNVNWGNTSGTGWVTGTSTGANQNVTVYAQIPANRYPQPGTTYVDTITATITGPTLTSKNTTFSVTATVLSACSLSATNLAFGTYSGSLISALSTISVTCTNTTTYNISLNAGNATGATVTNRSMTGPVSTLLKYNLFSNSGQTTNWGNTVGTDTVAGTGTGTAQSLTVYGRLPANQYVEPGTYSDTIIATITY